jgi:branched-chain amino acid transport system substrate-binding protein
MAKRMRGGLAVLSVGTLTLALGVFGSSSAYGSSSSGSKPTGTTLTFGVISSESGASGNNTDGPVTVSRWEKYINSHGGINGHPVKVIVDDDADNDATAIADATSLVKVDHAIAIGDASFTLTAFAKTAAAEHVPVISLGGSSTGFDYFTDANAFGQGGDLLAAVWAYGKAAALAGIKKFGTAYCTEVASCQSLVALLKPALASSGVTLAYSTSFSASEPNYTAICLAAKAAGVGMLAPVGPIPTANERVMDNCAAQHYSPAMIGGGPTIGSLALFKDKSIPKVWVVTPQIPWFVHDSSTAVFQKVMGSYLPSATSDSGVIEDFTGLQLFAAAAQNIPKNATPTSQDIYNGLYALPAGDTLGGLTVPLHFTKGKPSPTSCAFIFKSVRGHLSTPVGVKPFCAPASVVAAQEAAVGL